MLPALQAACGDGPRRAWQPGVRAPAQPQSRGQTTVPAEGPESRKDLKGSVSPSARSSQQPPAARLPRGPRVSQRDGGTACPPPPPRPRIEHGAREAHWAGAAVPSACTAPGHSGPTEPAAQGPAMRALHQQQGLHTAGSPEPAAGPPASRRLWAAKVRLAPACCTPTPSLAGAHAWTPRPSPSLQPQSPCPRRRALRKPHSGLSAVSAGPEGLRDVCGVTVET